MMIAMWPALWVLANIWSWDACQYDQLRESNDSPDAICIAIAAFSGGYLMIAPVFILILFIVSITTLSCMLRCCCKDGSPMLCSLWCPHCCPHCLGACQSPEGAEQCCNLTFASCCCDDPGAVWCCLTKAAYFRTGSTQTTDQTNLVIAENVHPITVAIPVHDTIPTVAAYSMSGAAPVATYVAAPSQTTTAVASTVGKNQYS